MRTTLESAYVGNVLFAYQILEQLEDETNIEEMIKIMNVSKMYFEAACRYMRRMGINPPRSDC